ncbi:MAG: hypothetical protein A3F42_00370 [Gammaproteobacteria bacterium RIFCSPHIGHO2_12_FULL_37_34]|nr:MAG: hypothetical protein A3F42_00370 [Gammaproteobacteria bacterium RIFCSPHIGHO2_12_FULL_37_34]
MNKQFFNHFWQLLKPYWTSEEKWLAWLFLGLLVICMLANVWAGVGLNKFTKEFYDAIQNFNRPALTISFMHFAIFITLFVLSACYAFYFNGLLSVRWRRWLTQYYLKDWLDQHRYYRMQLFSKNIDNPDQRISVDLDLFPSLTLNIFFVLFQALLTLMCYGVILWGLSDHLTISVGNVHLVIPNYLFFGALLYGFFGLIVTHWIGKKLVTLDYQQQYYNADFRYATIRFRESSEQIALYRGESREHERFTHLFKRVFKNVIDSITLKKHLMFFTTAYNNIAFVLGIFMGTPLYLQKKVQFGGMMQISAAVASVANAFAMLVNLYPQFAEWKAVVFRLVEFKQSMFNNHLVHLGIIVKEYDYPDIVIKNLTLTLPNGELLLTESNLVIREASNVLLSGPSGCGKSTLLRAIAGLWYFGEGNIYLPKNKKIFFLPQKPYLPSGSLQDVLLYPHDSVHHEDEVQAVLDYCELTKFQQQLHEIKNWAQELSLGEQQLLSFARIFLHQPDIIFLDEATSALDEQSEKLMYHQLKKLLPCATVISIGHRASLQQFHEVIMVFPFTKKEDTKQLPLFSTKHVEAIGNTEILRLS